MKLKAFVSFVGVAFLIGGSMATAQVSMGFQISLVHVLRIPELCDVYANPIIRTITIVSLGPVVEWSLISGSDSSQGEVPAGGRQNIPLPHYRTFILTVARPVNGKIGIVIGRENDGQLGYITRIGGPFTELRVDGLGYARVERQNGRLFLHIHCDHPGPGGIPVEYSFTVCNPPGCTYRQSEAGGWESPDFYPQDKYEPIPHYQTFLFVMARYGRIGGMIARENDGRVVAVVLPEGGPFDGIAVPDLGSATVKQRNGGLTLHIHCNHPGEKPVEYSILSGCNYRQSEAGGWAKPNFVPADKYETLPHYSTTILVLARYERIGVAIIRENDGKVGGIILH